MDMVPADQVHSMSYQIWRNHREHMDSKNIEGLKYFAAVLDTLDFCMAHGWMLQNIDSFVGETHILNPSK